MAMRTQNTTHCSKAAPAKQTRALVPHTAPFITAPARPLYCMKISVHCWRVSSGLVTVCPLVRSLVKISKSLPPWAGSTQAHRGAEGGHAVR